MSNNGKVKPRIQSDRFRGSYRVLHEDDFEQCRDTWPVIIVGWIIRAALVGSLIWVFLAQSANGQQFESLFLAQADISPPPKTNARPATVQEVEPGDWVMFVSATPVAWWPQTPADLDVRFFVDAINDERTEHQWVCLFKADQPGVTTYRVMAFANGPVIPILTNFTATVVGDEPPPTGDFGVTAKTAELVAAMSSAAAAKAPLVAASMETHAAAIRSGFYDNEQGTTWEKIQAVGKRVDALIADVIKDVEPQWKPLLQFWGMRTVTLNSEGKLPGLAAYAKLLEEMREGLQ
jgi:hypothetical protein